jgi:hypothetical protein
VGLIYSTELHWIPRVGEGGINAAWGPVIGYLAMALLFTGMMYYPRNEPVQQLEALPQGE